MKLYILKVSTGSYDSHENVICGVFESKELADKKGDELMQFKKEIENNAPINPELINSDEVTNEFEKLEEIYDNYWIKYEDILEINYYFITEMTLNDINLIDNWINKFKNK